MLLIALILNKGILPIFKRFTFLPLLILFSLSCNEKQSEEDIHSLLPALSGSTKAIDPTSEITGQGIPPILNTPTIETALITVNSVNKQRIYANFTYQNNPTGTVSTRAYLGRPSVISLDADGETVHNSIQEMTLSANPFTPNQFQAHSPELTQSYKIIIVAKNSFGKSSKNILTTPPASQAGPCDDAVSAPVTIGNCNTHCIQVTKNGSFIELAASATLTTVQDYLYLDISTSSPYGGPGPTQFTYIERGIEEPPVPVAVGTYTPPMQQTINTTTYGHACVGVSSYHALDGVGGFTDANLYKKIRVP
ncbi:hypothetical protein LFX25_03590 [Leptospira sp. FAT2]|uniref:hypothetical protein n=1 Tax=Leptospira sanjuanensis TaxID=2879643 RepID=UPI001EE8F496|nr:hypothetical protein [Leptospira sanjuanensis]MCG6192321.1 hypothetical protein [Leptospira sanjuanensis]